MKTPMSLFAAGLLLQAGAGMARADDVPLVRNEGTAALSNLKFTGDVQTEDIWWRRGYCRRYYGYGYGYGYGYAYRPYYYGGYYPYGGYYGGYGYPYRGYYGYGYRRIDLAQTAAPAANLGAAPRGAVPQVAALPRPNAAAGSPIHLTDYAPYSGSPDGRWVGVITGGPTAPAQNRTYPYNGNPKSLVPLPGGTMPAQPSRVLPPAVEPERPTIPRDGLPVSVPRGMSGEVFPIVYGGNATTATAGASAVISSSAVRTNSPIVQTKIEYPAFGDPR